MEQCAFNVHPINRIDHHLWPFSWRHRTECSKYFITGTNPSRPSLRPTVWVLHGAIISCVFGPRSHNIDPGTRQRVEGRHYGEPIEHYALVEEDRICTHGVRTVGTPAGKLDRVESYEEISDGSYFSVRGFPLFTTRYNESEKHCVQFSAKHWCVWLISFVAISTCLPIGSFIGTLADPCWAELW